MPGLIGKKVGMTSVFTEDGKQVACTVIQAGPCVVTQVKTKEIDGYAAVQLAFDDIKERHVTKPVAGHFKKANTAPKRMVIELAGFQHEWKTGDVITVDYFKPDPWLDVTGISKGKGFQGVIKRWNFQGGRSSHGSRFHRAPGSIGCSATPSRVFKNKKMPGQMGNEKVTIQRLKVVRIDSSDNLILIKGAIPGSTNSLVLIKDSIKA
jgi:large subunit ribosomal protein L3